ncbi:MAG: efflux RND transporter periplasmic adaptor subunit [Planctomycetota bacterium]
MNALSTAPILVCLAAGLIVSASCSKPAEAQKPTTAPAASAPPLVRVAPLELRNVRRTIETSGFLESEHGVVVQSRVSGRVLEVFVDIGDRVKAGHVLAQIDDREVRAALRQAEVNLADRKVQHELRKLAVDSAERRLESAKIETQRTKAQFERNQAIDPQLIPQKDLDDSRFAYETAQEALRVAELDLQRTKVEVSGAANSIADAEARVTTETLRVAEHQIRSPLDGVVAERNIKGGETISPTASTSASATPLFLVVDQDNLICQLRRPQRELPIVQGAREVKFRCDAVPEHEFRATIDKVSPMIDETSGSFMMRIRVERDDEHVGLLRPGMFIRARILAEDEREALMVPKAAVLNEGSTSAVFVVRDNVARRVVLVPGIEEREFLEAKNRGEDGLSPTDVVIVAGQNGLNDKSAVEVAK